MALDIGRVAYAAYIKDLKSSTVIIGDYLPWEELGQHKQDAWRAAAVAVLQYIDKEREQLVEEDAFERDIIIE